MNMIQLDQTKNHYLLSIPQALMDRAKKIKPRQWDSKNLVWKYPKSKDTYELLINEFENDVEKVSISPPSSNNLDQDQKLSAKNKKIATLMHQVKSLKSNLSLVEEQRDQYLSSIIQLTKKVEYLNDSSSDLEKCMKKITKQCMGENNPLNKIFDEIDFDYMLPINLQTKIESILKSKLKVNHSNTRIVDLIIQCRENDLISDDDVHFLHAIRRQRNLFAHNAIDSKTRLMRVIFVMSAFSLIASGMGAPESCN